MNRFDLGNKIYNLWHSLSMFDGDERDEEEIQEEIFNNLGYLDGINTEISYIVKYQDIFKDKLNDLLVELETYKSDFEGATRIIDLLYKWVGNNYGSQEETEPSYDVVSLGMYLKKELENDKSK